MVSIEDSNSLSDISDNNIDLSPSPKMQERKERKKRNTRRKTTNKSMTSVKDMIETDKVSIQGYRFFSVEFNIDKICA